METPFPIPPPPQSNIFRWNNRRLNDTYHNRLKVRDVRVHSFDTTHDLWPPQSLCPRNDLWPPLLLVFLCHCNLFPLRPRISIILLSTKDFKFYCEQVRNTFNSMTYLQSHGQGHSRWKSMEQHGQFGTKWSQHRFVRVICLWNIHLCINVLVPLVRFASVLHGNGLPGYLH